MQYDIGATFEERVLPLSTNAKGRSGGLRKQANMCTVQLMEAGTDDLFHKVRNEVLGACCDQGPERVVADSSVSSIGRYRDTYVASNDQSYYWPRCLWIAGLLHVFYNALETSLKSVKPVADFIDLLKPLVDFLSDRDLRRKFQWVCLKGKPCFAKFDSHPKVHIDWRWAN